MRWATLGALPTIVALGCGPVASQTPAPSYFELRVAYCLGVTLGIIAEDDQNIARDCGGPHPKEGRFGCTAEQQSLAAARRNGRELARYLFLATPDQGMSFGVAVAGASGKHDELEGGDSTADAVQGVARGLACQAVQQALPF